MEAPNQGLSSNKVPPNLASAPACSSGPEDEVHPAVEALRNGTLGLAFSGGGFMFVYFVGVLKALQDMGLIVAGKTKCAGASAGALACTSWASGTVLSHVNLPLVERGWR